MAVLGILSSDLVSQAILPFLLIFVLVFAVLDKSKILGDGKRQISALIALAIALMFITFGSAVNIVSQLIPFLAVFSVIILVFLIMYSFFAADKEGLTIGKEVKIAGGIVALVVLVIAVFVITDAKRFLVFLNESVITTVVFLLVIGGAIAVVLSTGKK
jgi:peptidoglycan/LPS O-acetylase OafA/YrhL